MGPVHVLEASHLDGLRATVDVQVVGKAGPDEPMIALVRYHVAPMLPRAPAGSHPPNGNHFTRATTVPAGRQAMETAAAVAPSPARRIASDDDAPLIDMDVVEGLTASLGEEKGEQHGGSVRTPPPTPLTPPP